MRLFVLYPIKSDLAIAKQRLTNPIPTLRRGGQWGDRVVKKVARAEGWRRRRFIGGLLERRRLFFPRPTRAMLFHVLLPFLRYPYRVQFPVNLADVLKTSARITFAELAHVDKCHLSGPTRRVAATRVGDAAGTAELERERPHVRLGGGGVPILFVMRSRIVIYREPMPAPVEKSDNRSRNRRKERRFVRRIENAEPLMPARFMAPVLAAGIASATRSPVEPEITGVTRI